MLHAAVTPCFFILFLVTFIYYRYYTHLFIHILYIYFLFISFFPFGPPSTHWVVPRALFIKLVKRSCPVPVTDTFSWVSFSLAVGALYKLYYYYYYYIIYWWKRIFLCKVNCWPYGDQKLYVETRGGEIMRHSI